MTVNFGPRRLRSVDVDAWHPTSDEHPTRRQKLRCRRSTALEHFVSGTPWACHWTCYMVLNDKEQSVDQGKCGYQTKQLRTPISWRGTHFRQICVTTATRYCSDVSVGLWCYKSCVLPFRYRIVFVILWCFYVTKYLIDWFIFYSPSSSTSACFCSMTRFFLFPNLVLSSDLFFAILCFSQEVYLKRSP